jgi:Abnormal spindle-like microcephaly-assoc'd, ASPM-SPD-2-Hydin
MHRRYLLWLLIAASALQLACGGGAAMPKSTPASNTAGQLSVTPSSFSFGTVLVGNSKSLNGMLSATNSDVTVSSASWNGQGFALSGISFPATVSAGQSLSFTVTFTPQVAGSSTGSLDFVSNASNSVGTEALSGAGSQSSQHSVGLSWDPSSSPVVGYNVYRGTQSGGPYQRLNPSPQPDTSYTDGSVQSGFTYFYVATAVGTDLVESRHSNETSARIP